VNEARPKTAEAEEETGPKVNETKLMHYDKEDLVSFHELFLSKALTKATSELDYEHPTVI
jgi:hypothetical protein